VRTKQQARHAQQGVIFAALLLFSVVLLAIQLWLFVGALEGLLDGRTFMPIPAAGVSLVVFCIQIWMFLGLRRLERQG
jgi:predicted Co/Zn/Cd cation transporter (cation efflux family)